ncbi:MAG: hypothetical protein AAB332_07810 [Planctomycetota bacterium]
MSFYLSGFWDGTDKRSLSVPVYTHDSTKAVENIKSFNYPG